MYLANHSRRRSHEHEVLEGASRANGSDGRDGFDGADGKDGAQGPRGDRGPRCTYRGDYDSSTTYNGSSLITDVVSIKISDGTRAYYVAKVEDNEPTFKGKHPTNTAYWDTFGANFSSVATDLLMARKIAASEIDVEEIFANLARIGNFTITNGSLAVDTSVSDRTQITFPQMLTIG